MNHDRSIRGLGVSVLAAFLLVGCSTTQTLQEDAMSVRVDTVFVEKASKADMAVASVEAGRFDNGKMWTFDNPPLEYFNEAYGFTPDEAWFEKAHLGALRLSNCSASFVSPNGLVMTNHHCARGQVTEVSEDGEDLLNNGFYASSLADERPIPDYTADQLISITDVTAEIQEALADMETTAERVVARQEAISGIEARLTEEAGGEDAGYMTQVVTLYNGGQYSAYVFKRYDDIRLVMAPELSIGYFGGDPDNFTYPRYNLDCSFYRVYEDGKPVNSEHYFKWSENGSNEGDAVFVIGNPGSTNRLQTVAELEYRRDYQDKAILRLIKTRLKAMKKFAEEEPEAAAEMDLINTIFGLENTDKARTGILKGLNDPVLMARRAAAQKDFEAAIAADSELNTKYGGLIEEMAALQEESAELGPIFGAFIANPASSIYSTIEKRAAFGQLYATQLASGVPAENLEGLKGQLLDMEVRPAMLEEYLLRMRLNDMVHYLGEEHEGVAAILNGRSPTDAAAEIAAQTAMLDSVAFEAMLGDWAGTEDAAKILGEVMGAGIGQLQGGFAPINARSNEIAAELARARFDVYGTSFPPDATFSLRVADGVVKSYSYNGTIAPAYTTFYGLYNRHYAHKTEYPWNLPERWLNPPTTFDMSTPLNFVSTNDIIGGNSGSPVLNTDLEVVGLVFDGNIESLPSEFIYTDEVARTVSVDSRAIVEALDDIYDADRMVLELTTGQLAETEEEADAVMR